MFSVYVKPQSLPPEMVERGKINKFVICKQETFEIGMLDLFPDSKIKKHKHTIDWEIYFIPNTKEYRFCRIGQEHELENNSNSILQVFYIKSKADMNTIDFKSILLSFSKY